MNGCCVGVRLLWLPLLWVGLLWVNAPAGAAPKPVQAPITLQDFAFNAPLQAGEGQPPLQEGSLRRLQMPPAVVLRLQTQSQNDFAVFNALGNPLPMLQAVLSAAQQVQAYTSSSFYPLWGEATQKVAEGLSWSFTLDKDSRIVPQIQGKDLQLIPDGKVLQGYIIQLPHKGIRASRMQFTWEKGKSNAVRFALQTGSDLRSWNTVQPSASLFRYEGEGGLLESSSIQLNSTSLGTYLRVVFETGEAPASMQHITIEEYTSQETRATFAPIAPQFVPEVAATTKKPGRKAGVEYSLPLAAGGGNGLFGSLLVSSLNVDNPPLGTLAAVNVLVQETPASPWYSAGTHTFFAVTQGTEVLRNQPLRFASPRRVGAVRFEAVREGLPLPQNLPLSVQYSPENLYVLLQGAGPYTLGWSGKKVGLQDAAGVGMLVQGSVEIPTVGLGPETAVQGAATVQAPAQSAEFGTYALWAVLGIASLALGGMALQLLRTSQKEQPPKV